MTGTTDPEMSGEARLKSRRNKFWRFLAVAMGVSIIVSGFSGAAAAMVEGGTFPAWAFVALWLVVIAMFAWFTAAYFRRIDEVDLLDNLWSGTIAFYFYIALLGSWYLFNDIGLVVPPNQFVIVIASGLVMYIAYGLRKLGWR